MPELQIELPPKLLSVFDGPADVRGAYGGRGSAKTRSFATMAAVVGLRYGQSGVRGLIVCGRQFMNSLADSSLEECKRAIQDDQVLSDYYELGDTYIRSKDRRIDFVFCGLDRNIESIKSKGRILLLWADEAEPVADAAWDIVVPTLREEGAEWNAELWVTWNPKRKAAAVETRWRRSTDPRVKVVELNWRDNPKFPAVLERQRVDAKANRPDTYRHVWEGDFVSVVAGAYYAASITKAREEGRIGRVGADPLMTVRLFCDIGGTGAKADNFAIWAAQFIGHEIRVIDHYEAQGQPLAAHLAWARERGYTTDKAQWILPHDGDTNDKVHDVSYASALRSAGYTVDVIPNQGKGAAKARIEEGRRLFRSIWFNEATTEAGLEALGWYHERKDEKRDIGLGPDHDWSSHSADAFGLMCVAYQPPSTTWGKPLAYKSLGYA